MHEQDRAKSALFHLDPACPREDWVKAGMASKAAGLSFDDFHNWSASAGNYTGERDCMSVWKSFNEGGPVTPATLYALAFAQGWQDPAKRQQAASASRASLPTSAPRKAPVRPIKQAQSTNAAEVWERCEPAPADHPYIARKGGIADELRVYPTDAPPLFIRGQNVAGYLAVPCRDLDGDLQTLQFIPGAGDKLNLPGASFGDGCFVVGEIADRAYIVEGIGQAWACHAVTGAAAVVCFGAGRMATVAAAVRAKHPTARLVLVPDRGKEPQAAEIARAIDGKWCELPAEMEKNADAHDYVLEHGAEALASLLERTKTPPMRYRLQSGDDLLSAPPLRWFVRGVLPADGLAALYGPSGSGKSFLALDLCAAIADGAPEWFGKRVCAAPVTYCALEGERGMSKRAEAWSIKNRRPLPTSLRFVTQGVDLRQEGDIADLAAAVLAAGGRNGLLVVDTLNRAAPGADENSSKDMGELINSCKELQRRIGGVVLLVHHTGKDGAKGLRGHSSLYAALDAAIEVSRTDNRREWSIAKSKDDEDGERTAFQLHVVELGDDEHGDPVTSCIVEPDQSMAEVKRVKLPQGGNQKLVLEAMRPLFKAGTTGKPGAPPMRPCIELEAAVAAGAASLTCPTDKRTSRTREAITGLVARGVLGCSEGWLWLI